MLRGPLRRIVLLLVVVVPVLVALLGTSGRAAAAPVGPQVDRALSSSPSTGGAVVSGHVPDLGSGRLPDGAPGELRHEDRRRPEPGHLADARADHDCDPAGRWALLLAYPGASWRSDGQAWVLVDGFGVPRERCSSNTLEPVGPPFAPWEPTRGYLLPPSIPVPDIGCQWWQTSCVQGYDHCLPPDPLCPDITIFCSQLTGCPQPGLQPITAPPGPDAVTPDAASPPTVTPNPMAASPPALVPPSEPGDLTSPSVVVPGAPSDRFGTDAGQSNPLAPPIPAVAAVPDVLAPPGTTSPFEVQAPHAHHQPAEPPLPQPLSPEPSPQQPLSVPAQAPMPDPPQLPQTAPDPLGSSSTTNPLGSSGLPSPLGSSGLPNPLGDGSTG
jgi:hypothetical protein